MLRLLDVVRRELAADDARAELGGKDPSDPHLVFAPLLGPWRIVAVFAEPPADPAALQARLVALLEPFRDSAQSIHPPITDLGAARQRELDGELDALAERTGAVAALVVDEGSPILWGSSDARTEGWDLLAMEKLEALCREVAKAGFDAARWLSEGAPDASELAHVDPTEAGRWGHRFAWLLDLAPQWDAARWRRAVLEAHAVTTVRAECRGGRAPDRVVRHEAAWGTLARGFAQLYVVVLVFDKPLSELHAEGALVRALPLIERLVIALPPVEPPPSLAKVIALPRRRR